MHALLALALGSLPGNRTAERTRNPSITAAVEDFLDLVDDDRDPFIEEHGFDARWFYEDLRRQNRAALAALWRSRTRVEWRIKPPAPPEFRRLRPVQWSRRAFRVAQGRRSRR